MQHFFLILITVTFIQAGDLIIGAHASWRSDPSAEQVAELTHLGLCFVLPQGNEGAIKSDFSDQRMRDLVTLAHDNGAKAMVYFGGGGTIIDSSLMGDSLHRATLITNLLDYIDSFNLDGLDNDWEPTFLEDEEAKFQLNQQFKAYYGIFTKEFRDSLDARFGIGVKEFSASVLHVNKVWYNNPTYYAQADHFPLGFWDHLDFIGMMNYDNDVGVGHSSYNSVFGSGGSIEHWTALGMPIEKICTGIPFYGRGGWHPTWGAIEYNRIIDSVPAIDTTQDVFSTDIGGGTLSYGFNNVETVRRKKQKQDSLGMAGMMICFINFDVPLGNSRSLLRAMLDSPPAITPILKTPSQKQVQKYFTTQNTSSGLIIQSAKPVTVAVYTLQGRMITVHTNVTQISLGGAYPMGVYLYEVSQGKEIIAGKFQR